jgi:transcriptional regulator with XRE-family HTH domain
MAEGMAVRTEIGMRLLIARRRAKLSQEELADRLGVGPNTVGRWERGRVEPRVSALAAIAEALGCELSQLLPGQAIYHAGGAA